MKRLIQMLAGWFIFGLLGMPMLSAQTLSIQGMVTDAETRQALEGANVALLEIDGEGVRGSATDRNGYYFISGIRPGEYLFRVSYIGFEVHTDTLLLDESWSRVLSITLVPDESLLEEVVVEQRGATVVEAGRQRIAAADFARAPVPAGSGDLAGFIQTLPGIVAAGDRGGQLFVRGGTPAENMVLMDGMLIYQPFHIVGFFSAFPQDIVSGADMYAGGFGARYSGRTSSVLDIRMREGNRSRYGGSGTVSPFLGEVVVEGPIKKGLSSLIASARHSLLEYSAPFFYGEEQPVTFNSQYLKLSHAGRQNSRCSVSFMRTYDRGSLGDFESADTFMWSNVVAGGRCMLLPSESQSLFDITTAVSYVKNEAGAPANPDRNADATRVQLNVNVTRPLWGVRIDYGFFTHMKWLSYDFREQFQTPRSDSEVMMGVGAYLESTLPVGERISFQPGAVFSLYREIYQPSFEPRLRASWQPFGRDSETLHAAAGLYRQPLAGITDTRDAGSAFTAWMQVPVGNEQMTAVHALLGWTQSLGGGIEFSVEGYAKRMRNIPVTAWSTMARFTTDLTLANGEVLGGDIRIEWNRRRLYAFAGYGISRTEYTSGQGYFSMWFDEEIRAYHPPHDRRHQVNALASVEPGDYTFTIAWQFGSGLPFTRPMGFDDLIRFDRGLPDVRDHYGNPRVIIERPYGARLPIYHRLDLSAERSFHFDETALTIQAGAVNAYNQQNMFYYDVYTQRRIDQMAFAPYVSVRMEF